MDASLNAFTDVPELNAADEVHDETGIGSTCHRGCRCDIEPVVHRFQFVTLAFDRPQTSFHLPQWHWPLIGPYNGFSGSARIRGWQLLRFYQTNGWLIHNEVCSVTGVAGDIQLHCEDYARPWDAFPVSNRVHRLIHTRRRYPRAWASFVVNEALPGGWITALSSNGDSPKADTDCSMPDLLSCAPHPGWVVVPESEFEGC
jgi:hypothetical protein